MRLRYALVSLSALSCATTTPVADAPATARATPVRAPEEVHFSELTQLTSGGENAEAYWSFDGTRLSLQARQVTEPCDRIQVMPVMKLVDGKLVLSPEAPKQLSSGKGATTCAHFLPAGDIIYASTHLGGEACPPRPDMSLGYVWSLYDTYDIFSVKPDGSALTRLTETPGYDAEGTVCGKDGSILFTSVRDGDIELYRMDKDGKNVKRLTFTPGYDGGAFFNKDCTKIVWRASRPREGKELDEYKSLLSRALVRPSKLELYVANADGSDAHQVTYLNSASFAPFWFPNRERLLFSSNYGDPKGREFDIWAINADGTDLERITYTKGFDGFPMFSPDGQWLAFSSNRMTAEGQNDTNLFVVKWLDAEPKHADGAAEHIKRDVTWLADPAREGRGVGTAGLEAAGAWLEAQFKELGLAPLGTDGTFRAGFDVTTSVTAKPTTSLSLANTELAKDAFTPLSWSAQGKVKGAVVLAGYGLEDTALGFDDYKGLDVKGKVVLVRRFAPEHEKLQTPDAQRRAGDLRKKAFVAKAHGAAALLVVDWPVPPPVKPGEKPAPAMPEAPLPTLHPEGTGDAGLPVVMVKRAAVEPLLGKLEKKQPVAASLNVELQSATSKAFNVVGRIAAAKKTSDGVVIIGAHYDHLGMSHASSLTPDKREPHLGADDNASGTATVLEVARTLQARRDELTRDVVIVAFSGEEDGVLGSSALVQSKPAWLTGAVAMLNLDMVGRLRMNALTVLGSDSAPEWKALIDEACVSARVVCNSSGDGYGPSDHMPFYTAGLPVLHFFTGAHGDYHKPSDSAVKLNYGGAAHVASVVAEVAVKAQRGALTYQKLPAPAGKGDARSYNASLGTVPNYGGPPPGVRGVLLDDVRPGGGAEKAGLKRGDVITKLGRYDVGSVEDLMFVLMQAKPGETVTAAILREGAKVELEVTFQEGRRR